MNAGEIVHTMNTSTSKSDTVITLCNSVVNILFLHYLVLFCYSPPPPPHQIIRKTVEIVPEKMKKSSIEILQIFVLSKYN